MTDRFPRFTLTFVLTAVCYSQVASVQTPPRPTIRIVPNSQAGEMKTFTLPGGEYPLWSAFAATPVVLYGNDYWPCFGSATSVGSTGNGNPACNTVLKGGLVVGVPSFLWSLSKCNGNTATAAPCGQEENVYEDTTGDLTDDVIWNMTATQWQNGHLVYLYDSGTQDYGTWAALGVTPSVGPFDAVFNQDMNFGTLGVTAGPNNGNCLADFNYPSPNSAIPFFIIADNKTCVDPVAGPVFFTATSQLATPTWTTKNGVTTVKYKVKYTLTQNWVIYLQ